MAVVWLNQNVSDWNTTSAWYYWDEDTQSAQPYNQIPQAGDTAYLNGYDITGGYSSLTFIGKISNALNPYTNRSGGSFSSLVSVFLTFKEIEVGDVYFMYANANSVVNITLTAETINLIGAGVLYYKRGNSVANVSVTGNISRNSLGYIFNGTTDGGTFILTGNISSEHTLSNRSYNIRIVGNASVTNEPLHTSGTLEITGNISADNTYFYEGTSAIINGSMTYKNYEPLKGLIKVNTLSVNDNFTITREDDIDITAIFTKYTMNNHQQYPPENEVKEGTEYVWGEKIGTYQQPPESVVLKDYEYDTITAEENDIATYNLTRYIYADYGTLHWFELKTTTTDIVTTPSQQSIDIDGDTVVADTDYVVEYNDVCYQWSGSAWGSITAKNIGTVKTDIVTNPTETTLGVKKGTLETIPQATLSRMQNALTVDIFQQILDAHLNN